MRFFQLLDVQNINTGYGHFQVLFDLSLKVEQGTIVSMIGPNGCGKSTILKSISGLLPIWKGDILFDDISVKVRSVSEMITDGLTYSPQGNRVFDEMSVFENLEIGGFLLEKSKKDERIHAVLQVFPDLKDRLKQNAGTLSGGEQQMLALARALVPEPRLLLLDEPSLGLAPNLLGDLFKKLKGINAKLGVTMLIVEQKVMEVLDISDKVYSIKLGRVAFEGKTEVLKKDKNKIKELFL